MKAIKINYGNYLFATYSVLFLMPMVMSNLYFDIFGIDPCFSHDYICDIFKF